MKSIIYTDGSACVKGKCKCESVSCPKCSRFGGLGSYILTEGEEEFYISKGYKNTTISRMEIRAVLYSIEHFDKNKKIDIQIYSDSQFVVNSFNEGWLKNWERDSFFDRKNSDLWKRILKALKDRPLMTFKITHTRGHRKDLQDDIAFGNHIADILCSYKNFENQKED